MLWAPVPRRDRVRRRRGLVIAAVTVSLAGLPVRLRHAGPGRDVRRQLDGRRPGRRLPTESAPRPPACAPCAPPSRRRTRAPGADVVTFNIPGTGVQTIALGSRIDVTGNRRRDDRRLHAARVEPEHRPAGQQRRHPHRDHRPWRRRRGARRSSSRSSGNTFRGLSMYQLWRKIWLAGPNAANNLIAGNFIGTNPRAPSPRPSFVGTAGGGILIDNGAHDNIIGEATLAGRNVISGNQRSGIQITQPGTARNIVRNNIIGLSPDGTRDLGNRTHGIDNDQGPNDSIIGGTGPLQRNVISGNDVDGVEIVHDSPDGRQPGHRQLHRHRSDRHARPGLCAERRSRRSTSTTAPRARSSRTTSSATTARRRHRRRGRS